MRNGDQVILNNPAFKPHQRFPADADPNDAAAYAAYAGQDYAPDLMEAEALDFIRKNKKKPFFLYLATTVPHVALQVPEDSRAEYEGRFDGSSPIWATRDICPTKNLFPFTPP